jgi:hypothetical protein
MFKLSCSDICGVTFFPKINHYLTKTPQYILFNFCDSNVFKCVFKTNADVFCLNVSSQITKFPPGTLPGRLSTTKIRAHSYADSWNYLALFFIIYKPELQYSSKSMTGFYKKITYFSHKRCLDV